MLKCLRKIKHHFLGVRLFYWNGEKNAGDDFNLELMRFFNIKYQLSKPTKANLACVGSILENFIIPKEKEFKTKHKTITIIGSGFIEKTKSNEIATCNLDILATRGYLSLKRLNKVKNVNTKKLCTIADPGILASKIFPQKNNVIYDIGIIPHYIDKNSPYILSNLDFETKTYKIIDIQQDVKNVLEEITQCKCILSSSLHGLIFADSYNIPNRQIILSENIKGKNYKFIDYYSAYKQKMPTPINLQNQKIKDKNIDEIMTSYKSKKEEILEKQLKLIEAFNIIRG